MSDHSHEIMVVKQHPSGAEEWYCPSCSRHFIVNWTPEYHCIVLNTGDETAIHNISKGAMIVKSPQQSDSHMEPWINWLQSVDLDSQLGEEEPFDLD